MVAFRVLRDDTMMDVKCSRANNATSGTQPTANVPQFEPIDKSLGIAPLDDDVDGQVASSHVEWLFVVDTQNDWLLRVIASC